VLQEIEVRVEGGIAVVTLNRPDARNAFTRRMSAEIVEVMRKVDADDDVKVVVFTGAGSAFCVGADLSEGASIFDSSKTDSAEDYRDPGGQAALAIWRVRKPVIAAIHGAAVGIGITLTLPMDLRVVAEDAKIGFVFVRRGIVPEACSSFFLPQLVGMAKAAEFVYTGRVFRAQDETHCGLFNDVVPADHVLPRALELAREIADHASPVALALSKALLWQGVVSGDPESTHLLDSRCMHWCGQNADVREGVASFLEKRPSDFKLSPTRDLPDFYPWRTGTRPGKIE
jgi:enoyl-CoA hydratase/carnithine racemase